jgi:hypothetical protein
MQEREKGRTGWLKVLAGGLGIIAFCYILILTFPFLLNPFPGGAQQFTPTPTGETEGTSIPSPTPLPTATPPPSFEIAGDTEASSTDRLGEIDIEYPIRMSPHSSNSVRVSIYIPTRLASLAPIEFERIEIPPDVPRVIGELNSHMATILLTETMRVELSSPTFEVENLFPAAQKVALDKIVEPTIWAWTIVAPETIGTHVLTLRVYANDSDAPNWVGNMTIEVAALEQTSSLLPLAGITVLGVIVIGLISFLALKNRFPLNPFSRQEALQRQILSWNRRLQRLQEKKASLGLAADPSLDIEIEDIEAKLAALQSELSQIDKKAA